MWTRPPLPLASWAKVPCLTLNEWRYSRAPKGRYLDRTPRAALLILSSQSQPMKSPPDLMPNMVVFNPSSLVVSRSEEHTSELQSLMRISYAVFCLKKKNSTNDYRYIITQ